MKQPRGHTQGRCCVCFSMEYGVRCLGLFQLIMTFVTVWCIFSCFALFLGQTVGAIMWMTVYLIISIPLMMGGWYYWGYLMHQDQLHRRNMLPRAHFFNMISISLQFACCLIFGLILNSLKPYAMGGIPTSNAAFLWLWNILTTITFLALNYYWMGVTTRFKNC